MHTGELGPSVGPVLQARFFASSRCPDGIFFKTVTRERILSWL
jgi:hypothetical protein